jgi:hypothetical protein
MLFNVLRNESRRPQPEVLYRVFRGKCKRVLFPVIFGFYVNFSLGKGADN